MNLLYNTEHSIDAARTELIGVNLLHIPTWSGVYRGISTWSGVYRDISTWSGVYRGMGSVCIRLTW